MSKKNILTILSIILVVSLGWGLRLRAVNMFSIAQRFKPFQRTLMERMLFEEA